MPAERPAQPVAPKPLTGGMRTLLHAAAVLVFFAGVQLFVFPGRTARYFAWTIDPPLTAAFLGASYWSAVAFEAVAARQRTWAQARVAVPTVFAFTVLTLVVTLVHLENFHLGSDFELATQAVTWTWIAIYSVVPLLMIGLFMTQVRVPGTDPPVRPPVPPLWLASVVIVQAVVLLALGLALLLVPDFADGAWPWALTPLTGRAIGAWLFSLGIAAAHAIWEYDLRRLRPAAAAFIAFALLQTVAALRFRATPDWSSPAGIGYAVFLASALVAGVAIVAFDRRYVAPE